MSKLLTHYTTEELNKLNNNEDYDFLDQMDLKRPFHLDQLAFKIDGSYQRATLVKENETTAQFLINGKKTNARYNNRTNSFMIGKSPLVEMTDEYIDRINHINSLNGIERIKFVLNELQ